jgi:hypothetical protein
MASQLPHGNPSPTDPSWRRNGYQIQNVPSAVQSHVRIQATMSPLIRGLYLPNPLLSVLKLAEFEIPPMAPTAAAYKVPSGHNWFSEDAIHSDLDLLTTEIRVPPPSLIAELKKESRQRYLDGAESICMLGIFHVHENHWVGSAVDLMGQSVEFGDPGGGGADDVDVCAALCWFVAQHLPRIGTLRQLELPCTQQRDTYNCGLYAPNAIAHKFLPNSYPLIGADLELGDLGRLEILRRVISKFHESKVRIQLNLTILSLTLKAGYIR